MKADGITKASLMTHYSIKVNIFIPKCHNANVEYFTSLHTQKVNLLQADIYSPSTSINANIQDISEHYITNGLKGHKASPQSIFKACHSPL